MFQQNRMILLTAWHEDLERQRQGLDERCLALVERISAAESRVTAKRKELADIEEICTRIEPLISTLIDGLRTQVGGDSPFLAEEHQLKGRPPYSCSILCIIRISSRPNGAHSTPMATAGTTPVGQCFLTRLWILSPLTQAYLESS